MDQRSVRSPSRCELDDVLQPLALHDDEGTLWMDDEAAHAHHYAWPMKTVPNTASLYSALGTCISPPVTRMLSTHPCPACIHVCCQTL